MIYHGNTEDTENGPENRKDFVGVLFHPQTLPPGTFRVFRVSVVNYLREP